MPMNPRTRIAILIFFVISVFAFNFWQLHTSVNKLLNSYTTQNQLEEEFSKKLAALEEKKDKSDEQLAIERAENLMNLNIIRTEKNQLEKKIQNLEFEHKQYQNILSKSGKTVDTVESWKLSDDEFDKAKFFDERLKGTMLKMPGKPFGNHSVTELFDEYIILMPIANYESIDWVKNYYSDVNFKIVCDGSDKRERCDINLEKAYTYGDLRLKTHDMLQVFCKSNYKPGKYKFFAKLDFDTVIDKRYLYNVIKFISDNSDRRIYYGNSWRHKEFVEMNGQFYAVSGKVLDELCACDLMFPYGHGEDTWFAEALHKCVRSNPIPKDQDIIYIENSRDYVKHAGYESGGVKLKLGRKVANKA